MLGLERTVSRTPMSTSLLQWLYVGLGALAMLACRSRRDLLQR